jgi:O-antigen/teichoic acid export membrane protein
VASDLKNKFVYQLLLSATQVLLPLVSYPYISRILGPANLGKVNYVDFIAQVCMIVAAFGIPFYAVREIAKLRDDAVKKAVFIQEMAILHTIFALLISFVYVLLTYQQWQQSMGLYILALANILLSSITFEWYLQGTEAFSFAAIRTIVVRLLMLVSFFILIKNTSDYSLYMGVFTGGYFLLALLNCFKVFSDNHFTKQPLQFKKHLQPLWHFFLTSSAISIYIFFDTIILQHITHNEAIVGYYTTVVKLVKVCLAGLLVIGTVLMPRLSYLAEIGSTIAIARHINKSLLFICTLGIPVCTGLYLLAPEIIEVLTGTAFKPAIPLMQLIAFLPLAIGLSNIFAFQILVPFNKERKFLTAAITGCIVSLSLNFLLIPYISAAGAAWANMITEIVVTIITGWYAYQIIQFKISASILLKTFFVCLLFIPLCIFCRSVFASPLSILLGGMASCAMLYCLVQIFIFKNEALIEIKNYALSMVKLIFK